MSARRCSLCGISFPNLQTFIVCPIHEENTQLAHNVEPDEDWQAQFERRKKQADRDSEVNDRIFPFVRGVPVIEEDGRYFVDQTALQLAGVRLSRMQPDQFYLFELEDGWIYETQGWDDSNRRWWVERVVEAVEDEPETPAHEFPDWAKPFELAEQKKKEATPDAPA